MYINKEAVFHLYRISISHISKWFKKAKRDDTEYWFQRLFNEGKELISPEFHHENHSGSVAFWILSCLEHFGGEYGRILSWQLQKHLL